MKKRLLLLAVLLGAIAVSACGKKAEETTAQTTEAAAETDTENATYADGADDTDLFEDEGYFDGVVTGMADGQITVRSEGGDTYAFRIADAETDPDYEILPGAYVEVSYDGAKQENGVTDASYVSVLMSLEQQAEENGEDPALQGTVKEYDGSNLIVTDPNGDDHAFDSSIAQVVSEGSLTAGTQVMVTYVGSIDEEIQEDSDEGSGSGTPVAIRIVTPDSVGAAAENKMSGTVTYVDGEHMMIDTAAIPFEFTGNASLFEGLEEGEAVTVTYTGSVGNKTVKAIAVAKQ